MRARPAAAVLSLILALGGVWRVAPAAEPTIRVGVIPIADALPLYAAVDEGYFAAEGVGVELTPLAGGARIIEAIAGGSLDLGLSATLSILQAAERGLDVVIPAPGSFVRTDDASADGLVVNLEGPVRSIGDLRGRVVGVNLVKSINQLILTDMLARAGVPADQVTWQEMPFPQMVAAIEARRVDAALLPEPFLSVLRDRGKARVLARTPDVLPGASMAAYVALRTWYEGHPRLAQAFTRAYTRGVAFVNQNPRGARAILVRRTGTPEAMAERMTLHLYRPSLQPADVTQLQDLARRYGYLPRSLDIRRLIVEPSR